MKHTLLILLGLYLGSQTVMAQQTVINDKPLQLAPLELKTKQLIVERADYRVVKTEKLPNESVIEYRQNADGGIVKVLTNSEKQSFDVLSERIATRVNGDDRLYENFGGWDGQSNDWLPDGWTRKVSDDRFLTIDNGIYTWHVGTQRNSLPNAVDGKNYAIVYYAHMKGADGTDVDYPQDEWLYTPVFEPIENDVLSFALGYTPLFLFDLNSGNIDWGNSQFINQKPSHNMHVLIKEENATEWTELMNLYDEWKNVSFSELFNNYQSSAFKSYELDLAAYVGKRVQVAYRFEGKFGNTMMVDAVKVSSGKRVVASYLRPQGSFYWGFSEDYVSVKDNMNRSLLLIPAFQDVVWENHSSESARDFEWTYSDPAFPNTLDNLLTSTDHDLVVNYPYGMFALPSLKASAEGYVPNSYAARAIGIQAGGTALTTDGRDGVVSCGVGNYNLADNYTSMQGQNGGFLFGYNTATAADWSAIFQSMTNLVSIANKFEKPAIPYALSRVWVHGAGFVTMDAALDLVVLKMNELGEVTNDTLAVSRCTGEEIVLVPTGKDPLLTFPFTLKDKAGNPIILEINDPIMVVVSGMDSDPDNNFGILHTSTPSEEGECNGYFTVSNSMGESLNPLNVLESNKGSMDNSFLIGLDATYPWIGCEENTFTVGRKGGSKDFQLVTYSSFTGWKVMMNYEAGDTGDWAKASLDEQTGVLVLSADALPENVTHRECEALLSIPGARMAFYISQDQSGTSIEEVNLNQTVRMVGDQFVVESASTTLDIFTASGQLIQHLSLKGGETMIPASSLENGMYLFKFADGTLVKVVK